MTNTNRFLGEMSEAELNATPCQVFLHAEYRGCFPVRIAEFTEVDNARDWAADRRKAGDLGPLQIETRYFGGQVEIENV